MEVKFSKLDEKQKELIFLRHAESHRKCKKYGLDV
ncbi:hypothetical protein SUNDANCE_184 [Brevibacillus phage Sundance]|nr:hypothetical protein AVT09_gp184 [Brevibacillus phage Sundance]ALA48000.1 hypothetical protein SUNDANCE_184 [Brevibacillus phage Sundance]